MLELKIEKQDLLNEETYEIVSIPETILQLEHSLISISKWEMKHKKPFLSQDEKTAEEILSYIECMSLKKISDPIVYKYLSNEIVKKIVDYIGDTMTATWFNEKNMPKGKSNNEVVTAEVIYYWMIALQIPPQYEKWHLNKLLTLIKVTNIKNNPSKKKMSKEEILRQNAKIAEANRAKYSGKK